MKSRSGKRYCIINAMASGSSDIDNVILNTVGGISGLLLFMLIHLFSKNEILQSMLVLTVFAVLMAAGSYVAIKECNLDLDIKQFSNSSDVYECILSFR